MTLHYHGDETDPFRPRPPEEETMADDQPQPITLRDYLAGQALAVVAQYPAVRVHPDALDSRSIGVAANVAAWAYEIADAMLLRSAESGAAPPAQE